MDTDTSRTRVRAASPSSRWPLLGPPSVLLGLLAAVALLEPASAQLQRGSRFEKRGTCVKCHETVGRGVAVTHQPLAAGSCDTCHKPHGLIGTLRLRKPEPELCYDCHDPGPLGLVAEHVPEGSSQHTLHPQLESCSTCHDSHGSDHPAILKSAERDLCLDCHDGPAFSGKVEHSPATDDCTNCHLPHGGSEPALLLDRQEVLCAGCHDGGADAQGQGDGFRDSHQGFSVAGADCASCHPPHSAASPKLLRASLHPDLDCAGCHESEAAGEAAAVAAPSGGSAICLDCHDLPSFSWQGSVHPPAADGACLDCHDAHTSDHSPLLLAAEQDLCGGCHGEVTAAAAGENAHEVAADCASCHAGHQSEYPSLLASDAQNVCLECHDDPSTVGDVVGGQGDIVHRPAATNCLACHQPHGTGRPAMLRAGQGELCTTCHIDVGAAAGLAVVHSPVATGDCTGCHQPHSGPPRLLPAVGRELCVTCHESTLAATAELPQHPPFEDGLCDSCHLSHASDESALLAAPAAELCGECHDVQAASPVGGSSHPPVLAGDCSACHQPHASSVEPFLLAPHKPLCISCHRELGERLASEQNHSPVEDLDGCATCHGAHSTRHPALLLEPVADTCLSCHDGDSEDFKARHLGLAASSIDCRNCHDPHASQSAGLLLPVSHMPFEDGDCSACHLEGEVDP